MEGANRLVTLLKRDVEIRLRIFRYVLIFSVLNNAHHFDERAAGTFDAQAPAEGILIGPEFLRHVLIDDGHGRSFFTVGIREFSSAKQGNLQSVQIAVGNLVVAQIRRLLAGRQRMILNPDAIPRAQNAHGYGEGLRHGLNAGKRANTALDFAIDFAAARFLVTDLPNVHGEIENVVGIEAEADLLRSFQTADEEAGDNQQHQ